MNTSAEAAGEGLDGLIERIPEGWSRVVIDGEPWGVTRTTRAEGGVISIEAEQLGGTDQLGANVWITPSGAQLRPCEVPAEKVMRFLRAYPAAESASPEAAPSADFVITNNSEQGVYEATIAGRTAAGLVYTTTGNRVTIRATSVLPEFRGQGVGARLISGVLDELREDGKTATITCPFTAAFVESHPEYADVIDPEYPGVHGG